MPDPSRLLSPAEVARELGVSRDLVYDRVQSGAWPAVRLGDGPKAHIRLDPQEIASRLVATSNAPGRVDDMLPLDVVAARIGRSLAWVLSRTRELPCVEHGDSRYVLAGDLRAWHEAAQEPPQVRDGSGAW